MAACFCTKIDNKVGEWIRNKVLLEGYFMKDTGKGGKMAGEASLNLE